VDNLVKIRSVALVALLMMLVFLSACDFEGGTRPAEPVATSPATTAVTAPELPATPGTGDQGPLPTGGTQTGAGGMAEEVDLRLVVLGGGIIAGGAALMFRRRLRA
jgi:hypothetical protein